MIAIVILVALVVCAVIFVAMLMRAPEGYETNEDGFKYGKDPRGVEK